VPPAKAAARGSHGAKYRRHPATVTVTPFVCTQSIPKQHLAGPSPPQGSIRPTGYPRLRSLNPHRNAPPTTPSQLCERWLHQRCGSQSCTIGPHDASAPPTTPTQSGSCVREHQTPRTSKSRTVQCTTPVSTEQKQKSSCQGSHSLGQAKEAHVGTERGHDIYSRTKRALPPHTQPIARHPALSSRSMSRQGV
jgi:hypothetical protein